MSSQYFRFVARGTAHRRCMLLERLLARADDCAPAGDWRAAAFHVIAPHTAMPAVGAALYANRAAVEGGAVPTGAVLTGAVATGAMPADAASAAWVCVATPVHYVAEMTSVRLDKDGMLALTPTEAETLASDFNRVWKGSGISMAATVPVSTAPPVSERAGSAQFLCIVDRALEVTTRDPEDVLGRHIEEFLPSGPDSGALRQLISETEMWLFEHAVNRARTGLNLPAINGLWFWGGGAPIASQPAVAGWAVGDDLFFNSFNIPKDDKFPSGVVAFACVPGSSQWQALEKQWLRPAVDQLRAGRITQVQISAADRCFTLTARGLRRFWRRTKPWWESFE